MTGTISPLEVVNNLKLPQLLNVMIALRKVIWSKIAKPSFAYEYSNIQKGKKVYEKFFFRSICTTMLE